MYIITFKKLLLCCTYFPPHFFNLPFLCLLFFICGLVSKVTPNPKASMCPWGNRKWRIRPFYMGAWFYQWLLFNQHRKSNTKSLKTKKEEDESKECHFPCFVVQTTPINSLFFFFFFFFFFFLIAKYKVCNAFLLILLPKYIFVLV